MRTECDSLGDRRDAADVMKKSRVSFMMRVGKLTHWTRLTGDKSFSKLDSSIRESATMNMEIVDEYEFFFGGIRVERE